MCPFFTIPSWQSQSAGCTTTKPTGEITNGLTPDVDRGRRPAGVVGNVAASGGQTAVTGVVLFPQIPSAVSYGSPIAVAAESCSLDTRSLCATVLSDFEVREFPVPRRPADPPDQAPPAGPRHPGRPCTRAATDLHRPPDRSTTARDNPRRSDGSAAASPPSVERLDPSVDRS